MISKLQEVEQFIFWLFFKQGFLEEGKTEISGEKPPPGAELKTNKLNPRVTPSLGIEPGPHWWEASDVTTALALLSRPNHNQLKTTITSTDPTKVVYEGIRWNNTT